MIEAKDRIILPLDVPTVDDATAIVDRLGNTVSFYKIGHQLIPVGGCDLARKLSAAGKKVFLDFKFLDIGATVEKGVASATQLNGDFITIHADRDALNGAVAGRGDNPRLKILAVTVLTNWNEATLKDYAIDMQVENLVLKRAEIAAECGADGIVASAKEAAAVRARFGHDLRIVTPGVRPAGTSLNDQKRVVTPADAIRAGSDHLVIGRPILNADDPAQMVEKIQHDIRSTL